MYFLAVESAMLIDSCCDKLEEVDESERQPPVPAVATGELAVQVCGVIAFVGCLFGGDWSIVAFLVVSKGGGDDVDGCGRAEQGDEEEKDDAEGAVMFLWSFLSCVAKSKVDGSIGALSRLTTRPLPPPFMMEEIVGVKLC